MATGNHSLERLPNGRPRFHGCSKIQEYEYICKLGEGTFGEVSKAKSKKTGQIVALKKILMHNEKDGFPITALREIKLLKQLDDVNILKLEEMAVERPKNASKKTSMFMVTPYMDHDLSGLLENPNVHFTGPQIKCYMKQLLEGCAYLHENKILHRDMKAANLLISNKGILQIADFGLARPFDDDPPKPGQGGGEATKEYTTLVVTRWYRPPELLLQLRRYTTAIDMWGVGCVFGEMFKGKPILAGNSDLNQAHMIFDLLGSPTEENMPGWSELPGVDGVLQFQERRSTLRVVFKDQSDLAISLLSELLKLDWRKRINAIDALEHPYFHTPPLPAKPEDLPSFEESHELDRRKFRDQKNKPPPAPAGGSVGIQAQGDWGINGRPIPPDHRHPPRYGGGRPYQNGGHGQPHGRRPPYQDRDRNGGHRDDYRRPPRDFHQDSGRRPPYDAGPRVPPGARPVDDPYSRRPHPDTSLPPRPPPSDIEPLDGHRGPPPYRERGDREERLPPRSRGPPGAHLERHPPKEMGGQRDTFIPSYSNADPRAAPPSQGRRPPRDDFDRDYDRPPRDGRDYDRPPPRDEPDYDRPPRRQEGRRGSQDYNDRMYDDAPPPPRYQHGRGGSRDYDDPPMRYDDGPPPPRRGSRDFGYDDRPLSPDGREGKGRPIENVSAGPPMYDRRSRSPKGRDWSRDRGGRGGYDDRRRDDRDYRR